MSRSGLLESMQGRFITALLLGSVLIVVSVYYLNSNSYDVTDPAVRMYNYWSKGANYRQLQCAQLEPADISFCETLMNSTLSHWDETVAIEPKSLPDVVWSFLQVSTRLPLILLDDWLLSPCAGGTNDSVACPALKGHTVVHFIIEEDGWKCLAGLSVGLSPFHMGDYEFVLTNLTEHTAVFRAPNVQPQVEFEVSVLHHKPKYYIYYQIDPERRSTVSYAMESFEANRTVRIVKSGVDEGSSLVVLTVPDDWDTFHTKLKTARYLECRHDIADKLKADNPKQYEKFILKKDMIDEVYAFTQFLLKVYLSELFRCDCEPFFLPPTPRTQPHLCVAAYILDCRAMLFGGTLLGWYRECGLIPDTTDMDLVTFASNYSAKLERALIWNTRFKLYWILGLPTDSLELSVYAKSEKIDLFFLMPNNKTGLYVGGMKVPEKQKLRWNYPMITSICTADLYGYLMNVPCNVEGVLEADYGKDWHIPFHDRNFKWYSSHHNVEQAGHWKASEWSKVYRTNFNKS